MKAILLVSHGSRSTRTKEEVLVLVCALRKLFPLCIVEFAFLEIEPPSIDEGIAACVKAGAKELVVALNFLNAGRHVDEDIPAIVRTAGEQYPSVKFTMTKPLGRHPMVPNLFADLINNVS